MFTTILLQELHYWFNKAVFYVYLVLFLLVAMGVSAVSAGIFETHTASVSSALSANAPLALARIFMGLSYLCVFLFPSIIGLSIYRDFKSGMCNILHSYPFSKASFLGAKFISGVIVVSLIMGMMCIGIYVGFRLPGTNPDLLVAFNLMSYLRTYFIFLLPNILFYGAIVFGVVAFTRNISSGFIVVIILTLINGSMELFLRNPEHMYLGALLDPFGGSAMNYVSRYWTVNENNTLAIPFDSLIIYNRLLWLSVALIIFGVIYRLFNFGQQALTFTFRIREAMAKSANNLGGITKVNLPKVQFKFSHLQNLKIIWRLAAVDFKYILKSIPFLSVLFIGLVIVVVEYFQLGHYQGTPELPVTWKMTNYSEAYMMSIFLCTFLYAGMLIHRAKIAQIHELQDCMPIPNYVLLLSKLLAIIKMQFFMLTLMMVTGISFQLYNGYTQLEIDQYLVSLFGFNLSYFMIWALLAISIQTVIRNSYIGFIVLLMLLLSSPLLRLVGIEQTIFQYGQGLGYFYSDMDGFGTFIHANILFAIYWLLAGSIALLLASLLMVRGLPQTVKEQLMLAKSRFSTKLGAGMLLLLLSFISLGFTIYYENNVKNRRTSGKEGELLQLRWEKKYKQYENHPQPRIVGVKTSMNIFPEERNFQATGTYLLVNKTESTIDSIFIKYAGYPITLALNKTNVVQKDSLFGFDIFALDESLLPGDSLKLNFSIHNKPNNYFRDNSPIIGNGTKVTNKDLYPSIGYEPGYELKDNSTREKYGLTPDPLKPHPSDTSALSNHMMSRDADWITYEATVSTAADQIALTSGVLQSEWMENGRRYFHYKEEVPILNFYSFSSGSYEVVKDNWNDVALAIYYHKDHGYNIGRMMAGMKASLAYNTSNFGPYQFKQLQIIEYPRTLGGGAQGFPNTIPFSEGHGFIADVNDDDHTGIDYPFAVTVHETAHQWWAHQVIGADVRGASMLTESISDYVRLKVIEQQQGKAQMRTYLKYALDGYLRKRGGESRRESPLMYNDNQGYIRYQKGSLVFYAISDYLGEQVLNGAIRNFLQQVKFQQPPYTTSIELVDEIRAVTPDSLQYVIVDMFEKITVYDNQVIDFTYRPLASGKFQVDIEFQVIKYRNDEKGRIFYSDNKIDSIAHQSEKMRKPQFSLPLADYIDIGIFGEGAATQKGEEEVLYMKKHKISSIHNKLTLIVDQKPVSVGVDPYYKLIDRKTSDNRKTL